MPVTNRMANARNIHDNAPVSELTKTLDKDVKTRVTDEQEYVTNCMAPKEYLASPSSKPMAMYHIVHVIAFKTLSAMPITSKLLAMDPMIIHNGSIFERNHIYCTEIRIPVPQRRPP